jgi:hypothetical protein
MWAGVLEAGLEHDDYRFRRAAYLRLGFGMGHQHYDSLDLQVVAHGLPMTIDGGQRPGYSTPGDRTTRVHNLVQVDGHPAFRHSWATALADHAGARYLAADATPPEGVRRFRRQIALVDVDEGQGSRPLSPDKQLPGSPLAADVTTPNSYVFDVFRVDGGHQHAYCFHGPLNDEFTWNVKSERPPAEGSEEAESLSRFSVLPDLNRVGDAPPTLEATWRMAREVEGVGRGEREMLGPNYDPDSPPKFTRLHLFGVDGRRALRGEAVCRQWKYHYTNLMVCAAKSETPVSRAFAALIEPYAGESFLVARRELTVEDNDQDARRAMVIEVKTAAGHTDVCCADGRPDRTRVIPQAQLQVAGEFAFYSTDEAGLRQATLVGGSTLHSPLVKITTKTAERRAEVTRVDYPNRKLWIDQPWPGCRAETVFEIGVPDHWTTYTAVAVEADGDGSVLTLKRGADYFRSQIRQVDAAASTVTTALKPLVEYLDHNRRGWVASDDDAKTFWRADYLGNARFHLDGPPLDAAAFGPEGVLRLWEYGVGDRVRQSTSVSLRRVNERTYHVQADIDATIQLRAAGVTLLPSQGHPAPCVTVETDGWTKITLPASDAAHRFRIQP